MALALRDAAFLDRIQQFLLHPTVRALSLAQRVDFLEQKGLTPDEITQCLRAVQAHNGLGKIAGGSVVAASAAASAVAAASPSKTAALARFTRKYGAASLLLSLLGYGYLRFRQRLTEQLVVEHVADHVARRAKRNAQVGALLAVIQHQQTQYKQAAELLQRRVASVSKMQTDLLSKQTSASAGVAEMRKRNEEVHALKATLLALKSQVLEAYTTAPVAPAPPTLATSPAPVDPIPVKPEAPAVTPPVRIVTTSEAGVQARSKPRYTASVGVQTVAVIDEPVPLVVGSTEPLMTQPVDIAALLGDVMESDEQATALSYRQLLAAS